MSSQKYFLSYCCVEWWGMRLEHLCFNFQSSYWILLCNTELQIRGGIADNSKIIFLTSEWKHIWYDPLLAPSLWNGSNDGFKTCFYGEVLLIIPKLSLLPLFIWSTGNNCTDTEHQIRWILSIIVRFCFFLFLNQNICCDPSLELSQWDSFKEGLQHMFFMEK